MAFFICNITIAYNVAKKQAAINSKLIVSTQTQGI